MSVALRLWKVCFRMLLFFNHPLDSWDVSSVTDMSSMFSEAPLFNQSLNSWDVSSVTDMSSMFRVAEAFDGDISAWDVSSVTYMDYMFSGNNFGTNTIFNRDISAWNVSSVTDMRQMFYKNIAFNQNLSLWGITQVVNFIDFMTDVTLSTPNYDALLIGWDAQGAMSFSGIVRFGSSQYTPGGAAEAARTSLIAKWGGINDGGPAQLPFIFSVNTSSRVWNSSATDQYLIPLYVTPQDLLVEWGDGTSSSITTNTTEQRLHTYPSPGVYTITIYGNVQGFYQDTQGNSDARKVRNIFQWGGFNFTHKRAFHRCTSMSSSATDVPTISTTDMSNSMGWDFNGSVDGWDISGVTNLSEMFHYTDFNQSLATWDFSNVTNIKGMFKQSKFNQDVSNWDTSSVTNMDEVFFSDNQFNQSLANWNIENVTSFVNFGVGYQKTLLDTPNYDATLIGWGAQTPLTNRTVNFGTSQYTSGGAVEAARNTLINTYGWTITDGGAVPVPVPVRVPYTTNLVASYSFDTDFSDYTGNNPLTANGNATAGVTGGKVSDCAELDGSDDYTVAADSSDFSFTNNANDLPFSFSFWANFDTVPGLNTLVVPFSKTTYQGIEYIFSYANGDLYMALYSQSLQNVSIVAKFSFLPVVGDWNHIVITYDGSSVFSGIKPYINSVSIPTTSNNEGSYLYMVDTPSSLNIGSQGWIPTEGEFDGKLDEFHIWKNRELTQSEVTDIYNTENAGNSILP